MTNTEQLPGDGLALAATSAKDARNRLEALAFNLRATIESERDQETMVATTGPMMLEIMLETMERHFQTVRELEEKHVGVVIYD